MYLFADEMHDKMPTQLFEGGDSVRGKLAKSHPRQPLQCGREGSAHDFV